MPSAVAPAPASAPRSLKDWLTQRFGFAEFRPGQREAIEELLQKRRLVCIHPTGYGKSLLYQLPSLLVPGATVVISPLLALMRDQLQQLQKRFRIQAVSLNTDQSPEENAQARRLAQRGQARLIFIAPEQLDNLDSRDFLLSLPIDFLVVDEVHCISTWGHDFRPSYRKIVELLRVLEGRNPELLVLGLTATANAKTEADILLQLQTAPIFPVAIRRTSLERANLFLEVLPVKGLAQKLQRLKKLLKELKGCGLLYCSTREQTELVAEYLNEQGHPVIAYHAGMDGDYKLQVQEGFTSGQVRVIAATNALGMGIDKADLRFVIHVDLPGSLTAYYQEVGRCGRDGQPARGILLFDPQDRKIQEHFIRSAQPDPEEFQAVFQVLAQTASGQRLNLHQIKAHTGLPPTLVTVILAELQEQGFIEKIRQERRQVYQPLTPTKALDLKRYLQMRQVRLADLQAMLDYGESWEQCLMRQLRLALGDDSAKNCGRCSACRQTGQIALPQEEESLAQTESWIEHRPMPLMASKRAGLESGLAVLNGTLHTALFVQFMRARAHPEVSELPPELLDLLTAALRDLHRQHHFQAAIVLPSLTWKQRPFVATWVENVLEIPVEAEGLHYRPGRLKKRQGELLNNEQRQENIHEGLIWQGGKARWSEGPLLLVDDYSGSGATFQEAARTLRAAHFKQALVPLALAKVRWRLGSPGFI